MLNVKMLVLLLLAAASAAACSGDLNSDAQPVDAGEQRTLISPLESNPPLRGVTPYGQFVDPPTSYRTGSGVDVAFTINTPPAPAGAYVVFQTWSDFNGGSVQGDMVDATAPFVYSHTALDRVPAGQGYIQAIVRDASHHNLATISAPLVTFANGNPPPPPPSNLAEVAVSQGVDDLQSMIGTVFFGFVPQGGASVTKAFTLRNLGQGPLVIFGYTLDNPRFSLTGMPASLAAGASQSFTVSFDPQTAGGQLAHLAIASNDADESSFQIALTAIVNAGATPTPSPTPRPTATPTPPPVSASGWTNIVDSSDTVKIYVSYSSGNDGFDGRTPQTAKKTVQAGFSALRDGSADQLLLKKGDVWPAGASSLGNFNKTGRGFNLSVSNGQRTLSNAIVIASYGSGARPLLQLPDVGFMTGSFLQRGGNSSMGNMAVIGIAFEANGADQCSATAIGWVGSTAGSAPANGNHMLFEDLRFKRFFRGIQLDGYGSDLQVRRNIFEDPCTNTRGGFSQPPFYVEDATDILLEENYFITRVYAVGDPHFVRRTYVQDNLGYIQDSNHGSITVRKNVYLNKVSGDMGPMGLAVRSPANITDNLFSGMSIAISMGGRDTPPSWVYPEGVYGSVSGNVILDGVNLYPADPDPQFGLGGYRGIGISLIAFDGRTQSLVENNIVAHKATHEPAPWDDMRGAAFNIDPADYGPTRNVLIRNNIAFDWTNGLHATAGDSYASGVRFENNDVQCLNRNPNNFTPMIQYGTGGGSGIAYAGNRWYSVCNAQGTPEQAPNGVQQQVAYPASNRSLQSYAASLGLATSLDALMDAILQQQSRDTWNQNLSADAMLMYFRAGFGR